MCSFLLDVHALSALPVDPERSSGFARRSRLGRAVHNLSLPERVERPETSRAHRTPLAQRLHARSLLPPLHPQRSRSRPHVLGCQVCKPFLSHVSLGYIHLPRII